MSTYKKAIIFGKVKVTPKMFPVSKCKMPSLNKLTETMAYMNQSLRYHEPIKSTNTADLALYSKLGYSLDFLERASLVGS